MKVGWAALLIVVLCVDGMGLTLNQRKDDQQLTNADSQAVRQLVVEFTTRFLQTKDLSPIIQDLYAKDFIDRYLKAKSNVLGRPTTLDFGERSLYLKEHELMKAMQDDKYFKPVVRTVDDRFFGFTSGTELIFINTPILFRLIIVKTNNRLGILWAEPSRT